MAEEIDKNLEDYFAVLQNKKIGFGYIKCRLLHMADKSIVMPEILMGKDEYNGYYAPKFFYPNFAWFLDNNDDSANFCVLHIEFAQGKLTKIAFFGRDLVKRCQDNSFIYKCAFAAVDAGPIPLISEGDWRCQDGDFQLALYHHTDEKGEKGIRESGEVWGSPWNIQGNTRLRNIAYGYFTSLSRIRGEQDLAEIAMSTQGYICFVKTNDPQNAHYAQKMEIKREQTSSRNRQIRFWVNVEMISPSHLRFHPINDNPYYYEYILPKVFRLGVEPSQVLRFDKDTLTMHAQACKSLGYIIVGNADTDDGLIAPYTEEETNQIAKSDPIEKETEIIQRWRLGQNTDLFSKIKIELAELIADKS